MRLTVASVGQRMPGWVADGWREYARRMPREVPLELREIPLRKRSKNADIRRLRRDEGEALLSALGGDCRLVSLDPGGRLWSTEQLAERLEAWMADGVDIGFMVGGPDGLDDACLERSHERWSLGPLTFPHPLVRVILAEQLYRAWSITRNHPYHRA
jgi:23S rRNA (pseudouridine1915-N3)-methyltransferase